MAAWSLADWVWEPSVLIALGALVGSYVVGLRRFQPRTIWNEHILPAIVPYCWVRSRIQNVPGRRVPLTAGGARGWRDSPG